jgi:hypothetical protein
MAPVEVNVDQVVSVSAMSFLQAFAAALSKTRAQAASAAAASAQGSSRPSAQAAAEASQLDHEIRLLSQKDSSINALIIDSYVRNGIKVPSAFSQLLSKMQAVCPRVRPANLCALL